MHEPIYHRRLCKARYLGPVAVVGLMLCLPAMAQPLLVRDPTQPLGYLSPLVAEDALQLQATIIGGGQKTAIINGRSHREGEYVLGQRILQIHDQHLVLESAQGQKILTLRPSIYQE